MKSPRFGRRLRGALRKKNLPRLARLRKAGFQTLDIVLGSLLPLPLSSVAPEKSAQRELQVTPANVAKPPATRKPRRESQRPNVGDTERPEHILSGENKNVKPPQLHVRDEPTKFGTIIGIIRQGENVQILERDNVWVSIAGQRSVWVKVAAGELTGWVFGAFLTNAKLKMLSDSLDVLFTIPLQAGTYFRTDTYGPRLHPITHQVGFHSGIDLAAPLGTPVFAAGDGVVEKQFDFGKVGYGRLMVVKHENGLVTYYAHLNLFSKNTGDRVQAGDLIGEVGSTGASSGPHLHFEVRRKYADQHLDPDQFMQFPERRPGRSKE